MKWLKILIWSAAPLAEQRVAIPLGIIGYKLAPLKVFIVSLLGSLIPAPFILLLFNFIFNWLKKYKFFDKISNFIERKINKNTATMEKYKELGLIIFIGIPLPTTGVWTGCAVASFLKLDFKKSMLCAFLGATLSAIALTLISMIFPHILGY